MKSTDKIVSVYRIIIVLLAVHFFYTAETITKNLITQASSLEKPMTDEEKTDHIENVMKASFAKIFSGIINAIQNPKEKALYVAECVNAILNVIWEATTREKRTDALEEVFKIINEICDSIDNEEVAKEIKKIIQEDHEARKLLIAQL